MSGPWNRPRPVRISSRSKAERIGMAVAMLASAGICGAVLYLVARWAGWLP